MNNIGYIVVVAGNNNRLLKVIDARTGAIAGQFTARGELQTTPVVVGNVVTYVTNQPGSNVKIGCRHKLPSGSLISYFKV